MRWTREVSSRRFRPRRSRQPDFWEFMPEERSSESWRVERREMRNSWASSWRYFLKDLLMSLIELKREWGERGWEEEFGGDLCIWEIRFLRVLEI